LSKEAARPKRQVRFDPAEETEVDPTLAGDMDMNATDDDLIEEFVALLADEANSVDGTRPTNYHGSSR
jgi:hypothetical protein